MIAPYYQQEYPLLVRWSRDKCGMEDHTLCNYLAWWYTYESPPACSCSGLEEKVLVGLHRAAQLASIQLAARSRASSISKIARWMGFEDSWNTLAFSWSIPVSAFVEDLSVNQVLKGECASVRSSATGGLDGRADGEVGGDEEDAREEGSQGVVPS